MGSVGKENKGAGLAFTRLTDAPTANENNSAMTSVNVDVSLFMILTPAFVSSSLLENQNRKQRQ
jgi:hypothetical protein